MVEDPLDQEWKGEGNDQRDQKNQHGPTKHTHENSAETV